MNKPLLFTLLFFISIYTPTGFTAGGENQRVTFENFATNRTEIFMKGHEGDPRWLKGFEITADLIFNGKKVGITKGRIMFLNPPLNLASPQMNLSYDFSYELEDGSQWDINALGIALTNSDIQNNGSFTTTWMGTISNGAGNLEGITGVATGLHQGNLFFSGVNPSVETYLYRLGF